MRTCSAILIAMLASGAVLAADLHVPADYPTIQAAIDAAVDGDDVVVAPGVYAESIDFLGKAITVRSRDPSDAEVVAETIICGTPGLSCVVFENDEGPNAVLAGFTITLLETDPAQSRRGVSCRIASPTVVNNNVLGSWGSVRSVYFFRGSPSVVNNTIAGNASGDGLSGSEGAPTIVGNRVLDNEWSGIYCYDSTGLIADNFVQGNGHSGIKSSNSSQAIVCNTIVANGRAFGGAGIDSGYSTVQIIGNLIAGNRSRGDGTAVSLRQSQAELWNNTIVGNLSALGGRSGGIWVHSSTVTVANSIVRDNRALGAGYDIHVCGNSITGPSTLRMRNTITSSHKSPVHRDLDSTIIDYHRRGRQLAGSARVHRPRLLE